MDKPFGVGELMARLRAALRHRLQRHDEWPVLQIGELKIDNVRRCVTRAGEEVKLTRKEFDLLSYAQPARAPDAGCHSKQISAAAHG